MKPKHANPQFAREEIQSLDGEWTFEILNDPLLHSVPDRPLNGTIQVPFCPESRLSGVGYTDFIRHCAYRRAFRLEAGRLTGRVLLRFGACDYQATVYVNGVGVGEHRGGYASFALDVTAAVRAGDNDLLVLVNDDVTADCPSGKQSFKRESFGCFYSRITGIWQSVWLEFVPENYIKQIRFYPDPAHASVRVHADCEGTGMFKIRVLYEGLPVGEAQGEISQYGDITCALRETHLWEPGHGRLYDAELFFEGDAVRSYFGLRTIGFENGRFMINGRPLFQRLVLDQGYYPDGLYTAPDASAIRRDIALATDLGFNGARLHQKVFEPIFLYECDRAGYLVWEELPSWGIDYTDLSNIGGVLEEWREVIERDFNHPSIITWCCGNEFWTDEFKENRYVRVCDMRYVRALYEFTKMLDETRPCVDASGGYHTDATDIYDFHIYTDERTTADYIGRLEKDGVIDIANLTPPRAACAAAAYGGQPVLASEYGGISYDAAPGGWGYRKAATSEELADNVIALSRLHMNCAKLTGMCYTQLYDVEQETNGLYYYDRSPKMTDGQRARLRAALCAPAAIELDFFNKK